MRQLKNIIFLMILAFSVSYRDSSAFANDIELIGNFSDVISNDGGEHCGGFSLALWRHNQEIFGLLDEHSGLCGDPPCAAIENVQLSNQNQQMKFTASMLTQDYKFHGYLKSDAVIGTLNGKKIFLKKKESFPLTADAKLDEWCKVWTKISRCRGVKEFCK